MKILVTPTSFNKPVNDEAKKMLEAFAGEVVYNEFGRPLEAREVAQMLEGVDGYIAGLDYITADALEGADALKVISRYGAGVDRVDLGAAKDKGIVVTNTPGTNAVAVCELAFALMLSLARAVPRLDGAVKSGQWPRNNGMELNGKTLGIVGFGAIGKNLATRAKAFGMDVIAYDPYFDEAFAKVNGVVKSTLEEVISGSDFISLHVPLNEHTKHMIGAKQIADMKQGAYIINTARGGLVDESAAADALISGKLGGVGLDAYEVEPVTDSPLLGLDNVVLTPHTGAHTNEAISGMGMMSVRNLIAVMSGEDCEYVVGK
ncbi:MAG: phosphoglycerate dehydrogenase [Clostridia bacterium]|jgi:D-3-phosphoglycerate dehydrogenase|nr:phosphoglycerate dehydrogenase [Clostridia bacterium]MBT7121410.1 phosphoglycerate dehydrogenase [Clostridia bacterium]